MSIKLSSRGRAKRVAGYGVGALLVALSPLLVGAILAGESTANASPLEGPIRSLERPQQATDEVPPGLLGDLADTGISINDQSTRREYSDETYNLYLARGAAGEVCVVVLQRAESLIAASCSAPRSGNIITPGLRVVGQREAIAVVVVPDDFDRASRDVGLETHGNIAVWLADSARRPIDITLKSDDGSEMVVDLPYEEPELYAPPPAKD